MSHSSFDGNWGGFLKKKHYFFGVTETAFGCYDLPYVISRYSLPVGDLGDKPKTLRKVRVRTTTQATLAMLGIPFWIICVVPIGIGLYIGWSCLNPTQKPSKNPHRHKLHERPRF